MTAYNLATLAACLLLFSLRGWTGARFPLAGALLTLPATLLHESCHLLVAWVTGGRPRGFSLVPRRETARTAWGRKHTVWVLGSVTIGRPGPVASLPSGLAPLLLLPGAWWLFSRWPAWFPHTISFALLRGVAVYACVAGAPPSRRDFRVACSSPAGLALYGTIVAVAVVFRHELATLFS